jgi:NAD(P)H-dependent glutamate synthase small subunit
MGDPKGFLTTPREAPKRRPVDLRLMDWREVYEDFPHSQLEKQAGRCMNCGIPFCHQGCPLGNLIPEWNDLVYRHDWREATERLHATNNFPEFTGTLCPAPCEAACVLAINSDAVTIKQVEIEIIDRAWDEGWVIPQRPPHGTGKRVAVVGSGPSGLAAAQQLTRVGHDVVVFERADRIGGLLRYGIPEFKMEKRNVDRRVAQMKAEGTQFRAGVDVGTDTTAEQLRAEYDAVVLAGGATAWRDIPVPGRADEAIVRHGVALVPTILERQVLHRVMDAVQLASRDRQIARRAGAAREHDGVEVALQIGHRHAGADVGVGLEHDAGFLHQLEPPVEDALLHLELGDAVAQQATDAIRAFEHRHRMPGPGQLLRGGQAGRPGAHHGDLLAGVLVGRQRHHPAVVEGVVDDLDFDLLDRHRILVDAEHAR